MKGARNVVGPALFESQPISASSRRRLVCDLLKYGYSHHSGRHGTLAYVVDFCERARVSYILVARPGEGYGIRVNVGSVNCVKVTYTSVRTSVSGKKFLRLTLKTLE